jgi:hypothetical protein
MTVPYPPAVHDFDFLHGHWTIANRRLKTRGVGADDWDVFASTAFCEPRLDGWTGMSLRSFDLERGEWAIWWISTANGQLQPPVRGRFRDGGCVLEGPDMDGERPILARYIWSDIEPRTARWTQTFSYDAGATWEDNWIMDFTRAAQ